MRQYGLFPPYEAYASCLTIRVAWTVCTPWEQGDRSLGREAMVVALPRPLAGFRRAARADLYRTRKGQHRTIRGGTRRPSDTGEM